MRPLIPALACLFFAVPSVLLAEGFGIIDDPDGWVNVRKAATTRSEVVARIDSGDMVWLSEEAANDWVKVVYLKGKEKVETVGFIHGSRIKRLDAMVEIPAVSTDKKRIEFSRGSIKVQVQSREFDPDQHTFTRGDESGNGDWIRLIDGKPFWGTDGGVPTTAFRSITASLGKTVMTVPEEAFRDLFEPYLDEEWMYVLADPETDAFYLVSENSDGAGAYMAVFRFEKGKYAGRVVLAPY